jgi:hypothetical protein
MPGYVFRGRRGLTAEESGHDAELSRARCNDCKYPRDSIGHAVECADPRPRPWRRIPPPEGQDADG